MVSLLMVRKKSLSRRVRESLSVHCGQLGADDGVDPNEFFKSSSSRTKSNKKSIQLCRQVSCCLSLVLGDCDDPIVQSLSVVEVIPAPNSSRLLVVLAVDELPLEMDRDRVEGLMLARYAACPECERDHEHLRLGAWTRNGQAGWTVTCINCGHLLEQTTEVGR